MTDYAILKSGSLTLSVARSLTGLEFERKYHRTVSSLSIPYICIPTNTKVLNVGSRSAYSLIGSCVLIVRNKDFNTAVYAVIADYASSTQIEVSQACAIQLGFDTKKSMTSEFTILADIVDLPRWSNVSQSSILDSLNTECKKRFGYTSLVEVNDVGNTELVDYSNISPFVATFNRNTIHVDMNRLKRSKVIGVMLEGGYLYDAIHMEQSSYTNPRLSSQIKLCDSANMPWGLWVVSRAYTSQQARDECLELRKLLRTITPKLGIWLKLEFRSNSISTNNRILRYYSEELDAAGFRTQKGIRVTDTQLQNITWNQFYSDWYLWLDRPVSTISNIEQRIDPEFFEVS